MMRQAARHRRFAVEAALEAKMKLFHRGACRYFTIAKGDHRSVLVSPFSGRHGFNQAASIFAEHSVVTMQISCISDRLCEKYNLYCTKVDLSSYNIFLWII